MAKLSIDIDRLRADRAAAQARVRESLERLRAAGRQHEADVQEAQRLEEAWKFVTRYTVDDESEMAAPDESVEPGEAEDLLSLKGMSASSAVRLLFTQLYPSQTMKVEEVLEILNGLGFEGKPNAVQVAVSRLAAKGTIERVKPGYYRQFDSWATEDGPDFEDPIGATVSNHAHTDRQGSVDPAPTTSTGGG